MPNSRRKKLLLRQHDDAIQTARDVENSVAETAGDLGRIKNAVREERTRLERSRGLLEAIPDAFLDKPRREIIPVLRVYRDALLSTSTHWSYIRSTSDRMKMDSDAFGGSVDIAVSGGRALSTTGWVIARQAAQDYHWILSVIEQARVPLPSEKREQTLSKLREISPEAADAYKGMRETWSDTSKTDRYRQAGNSLRMALDLFLGSLAPDINVKAAQWYESHESIRKQRVRYAIIGGAITEGPPKEDLNAIDSLGKTAAELYGELSGIAKAQKKDPCSDAVLEAAEATFQEFVEAVLSQRGRYIVRSKQKNIQ